MLLCTRLVRSTHTTHFTIQHGGNSLPTPSADRSAAGVWYRGCRLDIHSNRLAMLVGCRLIVLVQRSSEGRKKKSNPFDQTNASHMFGRSYFFGFPRNCSEMFSLQFAFHLLFPYIFLKEVSVFKWMSAKFPEAIFGTFLLIISFCRAFYSFYYVRTDQLQRKKNGQDGSVQSSEG